MALKVLLLLAGCLGCMASSGKPWHRDISVYHRIRSAFDRDQKDYKAATELANIHYMRFIDAQQGKEDLSPEKNMKLMFNFAVVAARSIWRRGHDLASYPYRKYDALVKVAELGVVLVGHGEKPQVDKMWGHLVKAGIADTLEGAVKQAISMAEAMHVKGNSPTPVGPVRVARFYNTIANMHRDLKQNHLYHENEELCIKKLTEGGISLEDLKPSDNLDSKDQASLKEIRRMIFSNRKSFAMIQYVRTGTQEAKDTAIKYLRLLANVDPASRDEVNVQLARYGTSLDGAKDLILDAAEDPAYRQHLQDEFNNYAREYDTSRVAVAAHEHLFRHLKTLIKQAVEMNGGEKFELVLDLGVGTGLAGELVAPYAQTLVGVDLSSQMINIAKPKKIYTSLHVDEIVTFLQDQWIPSGRQTGFVVSSEVLLYFTELDDVFQHVYTSLKPGGLFAATFEALEAVSDKSDAKYELQPSGRHAHAMRYIRDTAKGAGFEIVKGIFNETLRLEYGVPEQGHFILCQRPEGKNSGREL